MTVHDIAAQLPPIAVLRSRCQALAALECVMGGGDLPYYAFDRDWGLDEAALMNNGSGDEWAVVFTAAGAFIRVFDHESRMSPYRDEDHELWPGLLDGLPAAFQEQAEEPAFSDGEGQLLATAVLWRLTTDDRWHTGEGIEFPPDDHDPNESGPNESGPNESGPDERGPDDRGPDGSAMLAILFDDIVDRYVAFAEDYYETDVDRTAVAHVVAGRPLTDAVVQALNPDTTLQALTADLATIGLGLDA